MPENAYYAVDHGLGTVELSLIGARLTFRTEGRGLLDRPKVLEVALSDVECYGVLPVIAAQQAGGMRCDSEFVVRYRVGARTKAKRVFVDNDAALHAFLTHLVARHPAGSLLHLEPEQARARLLVISPTTVVYVVVGLLVGVPIVIALLTVALS